jgi:DNA replication factor GINS
MNLDELRAVQNKERQKDSLQHLRESFYADVADYVEELRAERDAAAEAAEDPFADPEVRQLTDEIETATDVVEAVYERRLGKLVKRASLAAAGMPADDEGLTAEERALFDDLVDRITENKERVLDVVEGETDPLAGGGTDPTPSDAAESNPGGTDPTARDAAGSDPTARDAAGTDPGDGAVDAAEAMGAAGDGAHGTDAKGDDPGAAPAGDTAAGTPDEGTAHPGTDGAASADDAAPSRPSGGDADGSRADPSPPDGPAETEAAPPGTQDEAAEDPGPTPGAMDERTTVRITDDVGAILGVDQREYDLSESDVVTLPAENAAPLLERDAAERVD